MTEEQLAQLLDKHLDAFLAGEPLPDDLPVEAAELLTIAQGLAETVPRPRPDFGPALKESLLDSLGGVGSEPTPGLANRESLETHDDDSVTPPVNPNSDDLPLSAGAVALLVIAAGLALLASLAILTVIGGNLLRDPAPTGSPNPTQNITTPAATSPAATPSVPGFETPAVSPPTGRDTTSTPVGAIDSPEQPTLTPIIDVLPAVTVSVETRTDPPKLAPGSRGSSSSNDGGGGSGNSGGGDGDEDDDD